MLQPKNGPQFNELTTKEIAPSHAVHEIVIKATSREEEREGLMHNLSELKLLGNEFAYSSVPARLLSKLSETGTYRFTKSGQPDLEVFCCRLGRNLNEEVTIVQSDGYPGEVVYGDNEIFDYFEQHEDASGKVGLAIYRVDHLDSVDVDVFKFKTVVPNPQALAAVILLRFES